MLLVDAHYEPARFRGAAAAANPSLLDNLGARQQASDVAFGRVGRYPFTDCVPDPDPNADHVRRDLQQLRQAQVRSPGSPTPGPGTPGSSTGPTSTRRSRSSSATSTRPRSCRRGATRSTPRGSSTGTAGCCPALFGTDFGGGHVLGTGNPRDGRPAIEGGDPGTTADLSLGVTVELVRPSRNNTRAEVVVRPGHRASPSTVTGTGQR